MDDTKLKKLRFQLDSILTKIKMKENTVRKIIWKKMQNVEKIDEKEISIIPKKLLFIQIDKDDNFNTKFLEKEFFDYRSIKNDELLLKMLAI